MSDSRARQWRARRQSRRTQRRRCRQGGMLDKVTDKAGRYSTGAGTSISENHNLLLEIDRRLVKQIAERIDEIVAGAPMWYFAASNDINGRILENLSAKSRATLAKNV